MARQRGAGTVTARLLPYILLGPAVAVVLGLFILPLWEGITASLHDYRFGRRADPVGLANYRDALADPHFRNSLLNTVKFVAIVVPIQTGLGLALAVVCLDRIRGRGAVRTVLVIPMVLMPVVVAIVFRLIFASDVGLISKLTGEPSSILSRPGPAFLAIVVVDVWEWTPLLFLILLAGLQALPLDPVEAARIDGAGSWRVFVDITLPQLRPILAIAIALRTIEAFGTFDQPFILTQGGPGRSTQLSSLYGYEVMFKFQDPGIAAAMLTIKGLTILVLVAGLLRIARRRNAAA